jgi:CRISPR-associated exonuclease Cas4
LAALTFAAQAICLEEMTGRPVPEGTLFYASSKRRRIVHIDSSLRAEVEQAVAEIRAAMVVAALPPPVADERCRACSLVELCQPNALAAIAKQPSARKLLFDPEHD